MLDPHMVTVSGRRISLYNPDPVTIDLDDMAHHLAMINRFNGAPKDPYTVAQHSEVVAEILAAHGYGPLVQFHGLIHDAPEYVTGDVITPMKQALFGDTGLPTDLDEIEDNLNRAIYKRFGINPPDGRIREIVRLADRVAFVTEWRDFMPAGQPCPYNDTPSSGALFPYPWQLAKRRFIETFLRLASAAGIVIPDARAFA